MQRPPAVSTGLPITLIIRVLPLIQCEQKVSKSKKLKFSYGNNIVLCQLQVNRAR